MDLFHQDRSYFCFMQKCSFLPFWAIFSHETPKALLSAAVYFADILYFIFYSVSPNLGHFGPKPVGLLLCASLQFSALVHPVQPNPPVATFQESSLFTMNVLQPLDPIATMVSCAALWPVPTLFKLPGYSCWSSSCDHDNSDPPRTPASILPVIRTVVSNSDPEGRPA